MLFGHLTSRCFDVDFFHSPHFTKGTVMPNYNGTIATTTKSNLAVIKQTSLVKDPMDSTRMDVIFLIAAETPDKAFALAGDPRLLEEGFRLVRKEGLLAPGIMDHGIPVPCDEQGSPIQPAGAVTPAPVGTQVFYYSVTYKYLGED